MYSLVQNCTFRYNACAFSAFVAVHSPACMGAGRWWWACGWLGRCPVAAELPPTAWSGSLRAQVPHTARWLLAAGGCRSIRCNGGADWAPSRRLTIPVLIGRDFFCRRFTFSKVPHSIPTHQTTDHTPQRTRPLYLCHRPQSPSHLQIDRLPSCSQASLPPAESDSRGIPNIEPHPLRQALYLDSPPSSASPVHHTPSATSDSHQHNLPSDLQPGLHANFNTLFTSQWPFQQLGHSQICIPLLKYLASAPSQPTSWPTSTTATAQLPHHEQRRHTRKDSVTIISANCPEPVQLIDHRRN